MAQPNYSLKMETKRFNRTIKNFVQDVDDDAGVKLRLVAFNLLGRIIADWHAVITGRSRAGWHAGAIALGIPWEDKGTESEAIQEGKAAGTYKEQLQGKKKFIEITNGVGYTLFLEYGHSTTKMPLGAVRINMRKIRMGEGDLKNVMTSAIKANWNKHFD